MKQLKFQTKAVVINGAELITQKVIVIDMPFSQVSDNIINWVLMFHWDTSFSSLTVFMTVPNYSISIL